MKTPCSFYTKTIYTINNDFNLKTYMKTRHKLLLILSSLALVSGISSCAPAASDPWYNITSPDTYGNTVEDVVTVINDDQFPWASGHRVKVKSLVTDRTWSRTFPHVCLEGYHYLLWSNESFTRVTSEEANKHAFNLIISGAPGYQVTPRQSSNESEPEYVTEKCSTCNGRGWISVNYCTTERCQICGGDGMHTRLRQNSIPGTYFLFRH